MLSFRHWNGSANIDKDLVSDLSEGRHIAAVTWNGTNNTITVYIDGVKVYSIATAVPARTDWTMTTFLNGTKSADCYLQRYRCWAMCLTDKQVSSL